MNTFYQSSLPYCAYLWQDKIEIHWSNQGAVRRMLGEGTDVQRLLFTIPLSLLGFKTFETKLG